MDVTKVKDNLELYLERVRQKFEGYEERPEQIEMIRTVLNGLYQKRHVMIEAGTGTGKSLAYLIALLSVMMAAEKKLRVVISTHTINLQEQLLHKDIPRLKRLLGKHVDIRAALAKGRGNYLCLRRFFEVLSSPYGVFNTAEDALSFQKLLAKVYDGKNVTTGDKGKLDIHIPPGMWQQINCSVDTCLGESFCSHTGDCFFCKAREQLRKSNVIVSNHALFFTDLAIRGTTEGEEGILPAYDYVVFDEAHHVEDVAADSLAVRINRYSLMQLGRWVQSLVNKPAAQDVFAQHSGLSEAITATAQEYFGYADVLLDVLTQLAGDNFTLRMSAELLQQIDNPLSRPLKELAKLVSMIEEDEDIEDEPRAEVTKLRQRLQAMDKDIDFLLNARGEDYVYWSERHLTQGGGSEIEAIAAPLNVSELLREKLFSKEVPIVLTSATLAVPTMAYMAQRLGVDSVFGKVIQSPFDYQRNARLIIPHDSLSPDYGNLDAYENHLKDLIIEAIDTVRGGMFVLFTSYSMLNRVHSACLEAMGDDVTLLRQGDMPRHELVKAFKEENDAVLFGTASFWEGVDVVGDALRCICIAKLPFPVPDHPLVEARMERLKEQGKNPFNRYLLPRAVLRFKQGIGRLIRSTTDTGIIIVADDRIKSKGYGKMFIKSIPAVPIVDRIIDI